MAHRKSGANKNPNRTEGPALASHAAWLSKATFALMETAGPLLEDEDAKVLAEYVRVISENVIKISQVVTDVEERLAGTEEEGEAPKVHAAVVHARNVADQVKMFSSTLYRKGLKDRAADEESE